MSAGLVCNQMHKECLRQADFLLPLVHLLHQIQCNQVMAALYLTVQVSRRTQTLGNVPWCNDKPIEGPMYFISRQLKKGSLLQGSEKFWSGKCEKSNRCYCCNSPNDGRLATCASGSSLPTWLRKRAFALRTTTAAAHIQLHDSEYHKIRSTWYHKRITDPSRVCDLNPG
jgi:hypothetical protein